MGVWICVYLSTLVEYTWVCVVVLCMCICIYAYVYLICVYVYPYMPICICLYIIWICVYSTGPLTDVVGNVAAQAATPLIKMAVAKSVQTAATTASAAATQARDVSGVDKSMFAKWGGTRAFFIYLGLSSSPYEYTPIHPLTLSTHADTLTDTCP